MLCFFLGRRFFFGERFCCFLKVRCVFDLSTIAKGEKKAFFWLSGARTGVLFPSGSPVTSHSPSRPGKAEKGGSERRELFWRKELRFFFSAKQKRHSHLEDLGLEGRLVHVEDRPDSEARRAGRGRPPGGPPAGRRREGRSGVAAKREGAAECGGRASRRGGGQRRRRRRLGRPRSSNSRPRRGRSSVHLHRQHGHRCFVRVPRAKRMDKRRVLGRSERGRKKKKKKLSK